MPAKFLRAADPVDPDHESEPTCGARLDSGERVLEHRGVRHAEIAECLAGVAHGLPIGLGAHDHANEGFRLGHYR